MTADVILALLSMLVKKVFYRELVSNASKILIILTFILPITEVFKLLDQVSSGNLPLMTLGTVLIFGTLASFPMILTIACFLSISITIKRYCRDQELLIWCGSGLSAFYWLRQVCIFIFPLTIICAISSVYITPWASAKSKEYANFLTKQQANVIITPGIFKENDGDKQVFYIESYSLQDGTANKLFVQYIDDKNNLSTYNIVANTGRVYNNEGIIGLKLVNGDLYELSENKDTKIVFHFDEFSASVKQQYTPSSKLQMEMQTMPIAKLIQSTSNNAMSEISWRVSIAIMMFIMCILVVPISIQIGRVQNNLVLILPPIIYAIYENLVMTLNDNVNKGNISIISVIMAHLVIFIFVLVLTYIKTFPKGHFFSKNK